MILIKTDNVILNTNLSNERISENKSVFSKKSSLSSTDLELSMTDNESVSSENVSKIKQKLDDFYHLNHKDDIDLKSHLKINSNKTKTKDEKDKKDETDFLNLEGLLLTQRKIYSQICVHAKQVKIEKKSLSNHESKKIPVSHKITVESNLKVTNDLKSSKDISVGVSDGKKENKLDINGAGLLDERKVVNQKVKSVEKNKVINHNVEEIDNKIKTHKFIKNNEKQVENNIENNTENKQYSYGEERSFSKDNTAFKIKENTLGIQNDLIEKSDHSAHKNSHSKSNEIEKNSLSFNTEKRNSNIDKLDEKKVKEEVSNISIFNNIKPEYQQKIQEPLIDKKLLDIPALSLLYKEVSKMTQPPSITYVFKKWGSELHQMKVNFDINKKIELIASTGRVYQSSLDNFNQYQGRLALSLENDNSHWQINAIDPSNDKEDEK
ncbi:hypothetical protein [Proteus sp. PR00224]|uniref:hypothetical protein n=1 Tax=Proteus sp. PR00224 TaxID=2794026 RepID=UPI0018E43713|nr:hypothetical protein [Proteus sp. PR00224]MBI6339960.1 hypothetical protein [Proteus sp. PR00224]